jgi:hypothetical protein
MIRARNEANANAQIFVANNEFLLSNLKPISTIHFLATRYCKCSMFPVGVVAVLYTDGIDLIVYITIKVICIYLKYNNLWCSVMISMLHVSVMQMTSGINAKSRFHAYGRTDGRADGQA